MIGVAVLILLWLAVVLFAVLVGAAVVGAVLGVWRYARGQQQPPGNVVHLAPGRAVMGGDE